MVIWKIEIPVCDSASVSIPDDARFLAVQLQRDIPCLWFLCTAGAPVVQRTIRWCGTGHPRPDDELGGEYLGTIQMDNGTLVFHAFID